MEEIVKENILIEDMIYEIRGKQVMLDSDLARLYQCVNGTKTINQSRQRHLRRFPEDFCFKLTADEYEAILKSQFGTSNKLILDKGGRRKMPYVYTEQGVAMLATVLRTSVAEEVSINIMRAFVAMRKYVSNNIVEVHLLENEVYRNSSDIKIIKSDVKLLQESFKKFEEKKIVNEIYYNGQIYDAYSKILDIFKEVKKEIVVIDGYADKVLLDIIRNLDSNIKVHLITFSKNTAFQSLFTKYKKQYSNLIVTYNDTFHDRYFILDQYKVYHCGTSINYAGSKTFSINLLEDEDVKNVLIKRANRNNKWRPQGAATNLIFIYTIIYIYFYLFSELFHHLPMLLIRASWRFY